MAFFRRVVRTPLTWNRSRLARPSRICRSSVIWPCVIVSCGWTMAWAPSRTLCFEFLIIVNVVVFAPHSCRIRLIWVYCCDNVLRAIPSQFWEMKPLRTPMNLAVARGSFSSSSSVVTSARSKHLSRILTEDLRPR